MRFRPASLSSLSALAALLVIGAGCGADGTGGPGTSTVTAVRVSPASDTVAVGATALLTAQALDDADAVVGGVPFTWTSSDPDVASVSPAGLVTGLAPGTAAIAVSGAGQSDTAHITVLLLPPPAAILIAAGDIADCDSTYDEATALLLDALPGTIAALGDNAYEDGTLAEYSGCYAPSWGRHEARTRPAVGNHEYHTAGAAGYWAYWGAAAGPQGLGYYSYDLGEWHIVVLNSNCLEVSCAAGSVQEQWLRADLAASGAPCTLAYWHHPRFSSGASHGSDPAVQPLWEALHDAGAEVILNGHEHLYERFAPQTPAGAASPAQGIRQFTVGTGGRGLVAIGTLRTNSEVIHNASHGVLRLALSAGSYAWEFIPVAGKSFTDSGTGDCH